jgi:hypothetical protein
MIVTVSNIAIQAFSVIVAKKDKIQVFGNMLSKIEWIVFVGNYLFYTY